MSWSSGRPPLWKAGTAFVQLVRRNMMASASTRRASVLSLCVAECCSSMWTGREPPTPTWLTVPCDWYLTCIRLYSASCCRDLLALLHRIADVSQHRILFRASYSIVQSCLSTTTYEYLLATHLGASCLEVLPRLTRHHPTSLRHGVILLWVGYSGQPVTCEWLTIRDLVSTFLVGHALNRFHTSHGLCATDLRKWTLPFF